MALPLPMTATATDLKDLVPLGEASQLFLSVYLTTEPSGTTTEGVRLRLAALLDRTAQDVAGTPWEGPFRQERQDVETFIRSLRPGGAGLVLFSSREAQQWHALWLPGAVADHVRFGRGAYVLPLVDTLDEWEPIGFAMVAKDQGRVMVFAAGRTEEVVRIETEVPGKHRAGGGVAARFHRPDLLREAGGGAAVRFQRHIQVHVTRHLEQVAQELQGAYQRNGFRRVFVAGPREALALFRAHLPREVRDRLVGEVAVAGYMSDAEVQAQVLERAQEVERQEELDLVREVVTRASKDQGAVVGLAPTLHALGFRQVHLLLMAGETHLAGRACLPCDLLLPPEAVLCPRCGEKTGKVDLWEELPSFAQRHGAVLEVVHGEAASELWGYDGIGALLEPRMR